MRYGFVIDNRKCIGCHACTVACKSEHDVPVGVNRTWVKQVEKGTFPNTKRIFTVNRCNHCSDAPCVTICPTNALYTRDDGIVDFNNDRCIGCRSCMQACPYDALYIDPESHTAAKCNYCAHRVDIGLEPACVNVCPEHAIISGDMENPDTEIAQLIAMQEVRTRKAEKGTLPNVYYIKGDESSLNTAATERSSSYIWGSQSNGVGHYSKYAEKLTEGKDLINMIDELNAGARENVTTYGSGEKKKQVEVIMESAKARRVYDTPDKGLLWGWEVSAYVLTKAIAAGIFIVYSIARFLSLPVSTELEMGIGVISLFFLLLTGALLVKDLDRPDRFLYVLLRPSWDSWLVRGGYSISIFGGAVTAWIAGIFLDIPILENVGFAVGFLSAIVVAVYTAFLFAQAKGRDFWQSPGLVIHMFIHSLLAGGSFLLLTGMFIELSKEWMNIIYIILYSALGMNLMTMLVELYFTHPTNDASRAAEMILKGRYARLFWIGVVVICNILPIGLLFAGEQVNLLASILILVGIYLNEKVWIEAPQRIPLT